MTSREKSANLRHWTGLKKPLAADAARIIQEHSRLHPRIHKQVLSYVAILYLAGHWPSFGVHGLVSFLFAASLRVGSGAQAYAGRIRLGAAFAELFFQLAAALRRSGSHRLMVEACAQRFQFAHARCLLVCECGLSMAGSSALATRDRAGTAGLRGDCSRVVPLGCSGIAQIVAEHCIERKTRPAARTDGRA